MNYPKPFNRTFLRPGPAGLSMLFALACTTGCPGDDVPTVDTTGEDSTGGSTTDSTVTTPTTVTVTMTGADSTTTGMDTETDGVDSTSTGDACGNGVVDDGEECDGDDLDGMACSDQGFDAGDLACNDDCTFNTDACTLNCGNDVIDDGEECDGADLGGLDCPGLDAMYDRGELGCNDDCTYDVSMCVTWECGDDMINGMDVCDGADLGGNDCTTIEWMPGTNYDGGTLACEMGCAAFDTTGCFVCGDDAIGGAEVCDGTDLAGADCTTLGMGFTGGTLGCATDCTGYDTSGCYTCGDGTADPGEDCDMADLGGNDCTTIGMGFDGGTLGCDMACAFDTSACTTCGDGVAEGAEACDGMDLGGNDCMGATGFPMGTLACDASCNLDGSGCFSEVTTCSTPGTPITGGVITDTIPVPAGGGFLTDVDVYVDASHAWVGDLDIDVQHVESGGTQRLIDGICGSDDDLLVTFDSQAADFINCALPFPVGQGGSALPDPGNLNAYSGIPDVPTTWELIVEDTFPAGDDGVWNEWCVITRYGPVDPTVCGDGVITFGEDCEGMDLGGQDCTGLGYLNGGTLACDPASCGFDTALCDASEGLCGDGTITSDGVGPDEECDGNEIASTQCEDLGFVGGSLDCGFPDCGFDTSECSDTVIAVCNSPASFITNGAPVNDTVNVPVGSGNVTDIDVHVDITHTWDGDLDIFLTHDLTGTVVELSTDQCGSGDDVFAFFNDEGNGLPDCIGPIDIEGNINAEGVLAGFDGELAEGDWTLNITDDAGGDDGTLNQWCIYITP